MASFHFTIQDPFPKAKKNILDDFILSVRYNGYKRISRVSAARLDTYLADGWRHFGNLFFRSRIEYVFGESDTLENNALRIKVPEYSYSKGDRRTINANADTSVSVSRAVATPEHRQLFDLHYRKFQKIRGIEVDDIIGSRNAKGNAPTDIYMNEVLLGSELIAVSYFDVSNEAVSSIYAFYNTALTKRRLGIFTLLCEMELAKRLEKKYLYIGYAPANSSAMDYKKRFRALQSYDWKGNWHDVICDDDGVLQPL